MSGEQVLSVTGLGKSYGGIPVFTDVSFAVALGEAVAAVGRNGSGKSTLLKCLVRAEAYDSGDVALFGASLDESSAEVRADLACLLDDIDFFPDISVVEHLRLLAWLHGVDTPEDRVAAVVDDVGLRRVQDQLPPTLSSGQRHRLGLASCFVRPRRLLVLDEPEQRLDREGRRWLRDRLRAEKLAGVAIILASHDAELIDAVADRQVVLNTRD